MPTFKTDLEAVADNKKELRIPLELLEAYFLSKGWDFAMFRATPHYLIEQVQFIWHLEGITEKASNRNAGKSKAKK